MNAAEIKAALNNRGEEFARSLFPAGKKSGHEWVVGSLNGEAGKSLSICIAGSRAGMFADFATDEKGDNLVELYSQAKRVEFKEALRACAQWLGVTISSRSPASGITRKVPSVGPVPVSPVAMPDAVRETWFEGVEYLLANPTLADELAKFRGWPVEYGRYVAGCAVLSMPKYGAARGVAFLVVAPLGQQGSMTTLDVGYHIRLKSKGGDKSSWRYVPNAKQYGQQIPALPFLVGDFDTANLLIVTEGQWDALTFALAAGWLGDDCIWPKGVGLIGVRGVSGVDPFLQHYRRFWPKDANCLLLPDRDPAGGKWFEEGDSFADRLARLCRRVAVIGYGEHKDFNDLYRAERVTPEHVAELLDAHGMSVESGVTA